MKLFDHIAIVYNPKSTGDAPKMAKDLYDSVLGHYELIRRKPVLYPTKYHKHAIEIAKEVTEKYYYPLIVSVSGDGGYNEVINGIMLGKQTRKTSQAVAAVMAAGNANDHKRVMRGNTPLIRLIKQAKPKPLDLISAKAQASDYELERYAHSYIGFGITPEVGHELNRHQKSRLTEIWIVLSTLKTFQPMTVIRDGKEHKFDNLVFANINEMAKFVKLDSENTVHDDQFEVIAVKHRGRLHLIRSMISAVLSGFHKPPSFNKYSFELVDEQPMQLDGEVEILPPNAKVTIKSHADAILSLY